MDTTEEVGARLSLKDRQQFVSDSKAAAQSVEQIGSAATSAGDKAVASKKKFSLFSRDVKSAGVAAADSMGAAGLKAGGAFADGFTRDAQGRLHDANGKFVRAGSVAGGAMGKGFRAEADAAVSEVGSSGGILGRVGKGFEVAGIGAGRRFGTALRENAMTYIKTIGATMIGFFAAEKVKEGITEGIHLANDAARAQKSTAAAIKSTHDASGETTKSIHGMAEELSHVSAQSPIATQGLLNMLLTFPKIKKGHGIFKETASLSQDLATRLGVGLPSAAKMLGRALSDPAKSLGALSRAGIKFGADQTKVIQNLVATGNTAKAQAIILQAVHTRVGGAAAAAVTPTDRLRLAWENFEEKMGKKILPLLNRFDTWMAKKGITDIEHFGSSVKKLLWPPLHTVINFIEKYGIPAAKWLFGFLQKHIKTIQEIAKYFLVFLVVMKGYVLVVKGIIAAMKAWAAIQMLLNGEMDANPIGLIIIAVAALTTGIIYLYNHSKTFRDFIKGAGHVIAGVFDFIKEHWKLFATIFVGLVLGPIAGAVLFMITHWKLTKRVFWDMVHGIETGAKAVWHFIVDYIAHPIRTAYDFVKHWGGKVVNFITNIPHMIATGFKDLGQIFIAPFAWAFNKISWLWNHTAGELSFHLPGWIPGLGHKGFSMPKLPYMDVPAMAAGGQVTAGQMYLVGEAGPELFRPASAGTIIPNQRITTRSHTVRLSEHRLLESDSGDGQPIVLQVLLDGKVLAESTYAHTRRKVARQ